MMKKKLNFLGKPKNLFIRNSRFTHLLFIAKHQERVQLVQLWKREMISLFTVIRYSFLKESFGRFGFNLGSFLNGELFFCVLMAFQLRDEWYSNLVSGLLKHKVLALLLQKPNVLFTLKRLQSFPLILQIFLQQKSSFCIMFYQSLCKIYLLLFIRILISHRCPRFGWLKIKLVL